MARVLIVDDDRSTRQIVRLLLEDEGYDVSEAAGGEAALALLRTSAEPLVVLLDHHMPRMSGGHVLRVAIHEGLVQRHAFVLLAAAPRLLDPKLETKAKALGIPVVIKPFHIDALLTIVAGRAAQLDAAWHHAVAG